jgi:hypothetical protein
MILRNTLLKDNIIIHKFIIERDINSLNLVKCNQLYYNYKNLELYKSLIYYNNLKNYYDKKYIQLKSDIIYFDLKYQKIIYNYNELNDFDINKYQKLLKDRVIHHDILSNDYKKYFKSDDVDDFLRIYFDIFLEIRNNYFGQK